MKSFFELPWLLLVLTSYFTATFNNSNQKHLEVFAPLLLCSVGLAASFFLFKDHTPRATGLFTIIRFFGAGFVGTLSIYYIWMEFGTPYLKETALGLLPTYLITGLLILLVLLGLTIFEAIHSRS